MSFTADIVIRGADGLPLVVVELENRKGLTSKVGADLRRELIADRGLGARASFLLVLSQEMGFLWAGPLADASDEATWTFSMAELIGDYLDPTGVERGTWLWPDAFRLVVLQWLYDLIDGKRDEANEPERTLAESGLLAALWGAHITEGVPV